jgi:hypothetical protein
LAIPLGDVSIPFRMKGENLREESIQDSSFFISKHPLGFQHPTSVFTQNRHVVSGKRMHHIFSSPLFLFLRRAPPSGMKGEIKKGAVYSPFGTKGERGMLHPERVERAAPSKSKEDVG